MKRRNFSVLSGVGPAAAVALPGSAPAQTKPPVAGTDYLVLDKPAPVEAARGKIEVVEFFWYSCSHCNAFEPALNAWAKALPKDVALRRVPVAFRDDFVPQQRLYYALEALGLLAKLHAQVFVAIHVDKQKLASAAEIADWAAKQGVDRAKFTEQYNSFSASTKATRGTQLQNTYKVEGVPALGVAGRFYIDSTLAQSMERALKVADFLTAEVRSGR
ncbi:MAG: thiol:disulfide interchange protein DsbA/DsbL [Burkholderiales bacterium]|nr:thiol:disulfide interchange protein DsbA/DsbL [Burkholderiales bacterium]